MTRSTRTKPTPQPRITTTSDPATAAAYSHSLAIIAEQYAALADLDATMLSNTDRRDFLGALDTTANLARALQYPLIRANYDQNAHCELGWARPEGVTVDATRCSAAEARRRERRAFRITGHTTPTGHRVPPQHPRLVAAVDDGAMNDENLTVIEEFEKYLDGEESVNREDFDWSMNTLGDNARTLHPDALRAVARELTDRLLPDGKLDDKKNTDTPFLDIGKQKPNGLSGIRGLIAAPLRAYLESVNGKFAAPGALVTNTGPDASADTNASTDADADADPSTGEPPADPIDDDQIGLFDNDNDKDNDGSGDASDNSESFDDCSNSESTDDDDPSDDTDDTDESTPPGTTPLTIPAVFDERAAGQRRHDALLHALTIAATSGKLGTHRGLPAIPVVTMTLQQLESRTGWARTAFGTRIRIADAVALLADSIPYLVVFDDHEHRPLHLGRAKRTATLDQRIALLATDRGCSFTDCANPPAFCEVHHRNGDWKDGATTDIGDLTFTCTTHHRKAGDGATQFTSSTAGPDHAHPGRTLWHHNTADPDKTSGRINHAHHPEDHLPDGYLDT